MEENKFLVLDTSVVVKWFSSEEEDLKQALNIYYRHGAGEFRVIVPEHFYAEFNDVFFQKALYFVEDFFSKVKMLGFITQNTTLECVALATSLKRKYPKISFYDAAYHAIALMKGVLFVTADRQYYDTVKREGNILLLKNYV